MSKRTVHLSNAEGEITVDVLDGVVRVFDIPKILKLYRDNPGADFVMGMKTDHFWTFNHIKSESDIINYHCMVTDWDTPVVEINGAETECYVEIPAHIPATIEAYVKNKMKNTDNMRKSLKALKKSRKAA